MSLITITELTTRTLDRRAFLAATALAAGALTFADALLERRPIRIRGRVRSRGRGVTGVTVTDGHSVVSTDRDGRYELVSSAAQRFLSICLPAGYRIPVSTTGTAWLHRAIAPDAHGEMSALFDLEPLDVSDHAHAFLVLADPQTQDMTEVGFLHTQTVPDVRTAVGALSGLPMFGVGCGDMMFGNLELFPEWERAVAHMGVPFFQVVGNHDIVFDERADARSTATFERHFGPTYYSFDRGAVHYVVLDDVMLRLYDVDYFGFVDERQLTWLAADLARVERGRPVVVFVHIPTQSTPGRRNGAPMPDVHYVVTNREALYRLLEPYAAHIMCGHTHENEHVFEGRVHEHVHGTVCGAWWSGPICSDGTPNGYAIYEVRGEEFRWRYKSTGLDASHQMRVYAHGADPRAPDEIVANVWGWDPQWTVVWYEDSERRGAMSRRTGLDPLAVTLYTGSDLPPRRKWVEPTQTAHLFYAPASRGAREVRVEATDRCGRVYTGTVSRHT